MMWDDEKAFLFLDTQPFFVPFFLYISVYYCVMGIRFTMSIFLHQVKNFWCINSPVIHSLSYRTFTEVTDIAHKNGYKHTCELRFHIKCIKAQKFITALHSHKAASNGKKKEKEVKQKISTRYRLDAPVMDFKKRTRKTHIENVYFEQILCFLFLFPLLYIYWKSPLHTCSLKAVVIL